MNEKEKTFRRLQRRINNFKAKLTTAYDTDAVEEKTLSITHNGQQWSSTDLNKWEAEQIIRLLKAWVGEEKT